MRISDWSSDVCSSDLVERAQAVLDVVRIRIRLVDLVYRDHDRYAGSLGVLDGFLRLRHHAVIRRDHQDHDVGGLGRSEEHTSALQSLMRISYAVFCLKQTTVSYTNMIEYYHRKHLAYTNNTHCQYTHIYIHNQ